MPDQDPRQRIEELEREVASLRAQVGAQGDAAEAPDPDPGELRGLFPSRRRAVTLAVLFGLLALAGILAIVLALSSLIEPLSHRAAGMMAPWEPDQKAKPAPKQAPRPAEPPAPLAPGL